MLKIDNIFTFLIVATLLISFESSNAAKEGWRKVFSDRGYPYVASVQYTKDNPTDPNAAYIHKCTGSVLDNVILTAANCFDDFDDLENVTWAVNLGVNDKMERTQNSQFVLVKEVMIHPDYDRDDLQANIAILKLKDGIRYSRQIQPIRVPAPDEEPTGQGILYGWNGRVRKSQKRVGKKLLIARVSVLPNSECQNHYPDLTDDQFCVGGIKSINAPCRGTPGIAFRPTEIIHAPIITGIATYWPEDCEGPALFTALNRYSDYILQTFRQY